MRPLLVVVSRSAAVRDVLEAELAARYGRDYAVVPAASADEARRLLIDAAGPPAPVALLLAGLGGDDPDGLEVLAELADAAPAALRVPVARWGDWRTARPIFDALALGRSTAGCCGLSRRPTRSSTGP